MMGLCSFPKIHWQPPDVAPFPAGEEEREVERLGTGAQAGVPAVLPVIGAPPTPAVRALEYGEPQPPPSAS